MYPIEFYRNVKELVDQEIQNILVVLNNCRAFRIIEQCFVCFILPSVLVRIVVRFQRFSVVKSFENALLEKWNEECKCWFQCIE